MSDIPTYRVIGTDHFPQPPEEYPAGEFPTRTQAEGKKAEIERVPMNTARIVQVWPWNCEPDYHPHWAAYEALERRGAPPEELEAARKLAEIEGHRQFEMPAINPS